MINRTVLRASLVGTLGVLTGCSSLFGPEGYFRNRGHDYLKADVIAPMTVPASIETAPLSQLYVIPPVAEDQMVYNDTFSVPRPQPMADSMLDERVKIQSLRERRWILVNATPAEVWPQIRAFLARNNLNVIYTDAGEGVMETSWLKFQGNESLKDKYRIKMDAGIQPRTTEIHVLHMSMPWETPGGGQVNWPARSVNPEREAWMVDELAATLASHNSPAQSASLLAQAIGVGDRVKLDTVEGEPVLALALDYPRAWATVNHALGAKGFTQWGEDDAVGVFYIDHQPVADADEASEAAQSPGFFSRWFGRATGTEASAQTGTRTPYSLSEVLQHLPVDESADVRIIFSSVNTTAAEPLANVPGYLVVVRGWDGQVQVRVRDGYGRRLASAAAKDLLKQIRLNLI